MPHCLPSPLTSLLSWFDSMRAVRHKSILGITSQDGPHHVCSLTSFMHAHHHKLMARREPCESVLCSGDNQPPFCR